MTSPCQYNELNPIKDIDFREEAYELFRQLRGSEDIKDSCLLHIDLMETVDELPVKIKAFGAHWKNSALIAS